MKWLKADEDNLRILIKISTRNIMKQQYLLFDLKTEITLELVMPLRNKDLI
jgi:hypothetical protein